MWPRGQYGGEVEFLVGIGAINVAIIFNFHRLIFIKHDVAATSHIAFGGAYMKEEDSWSTDSMLTSSFPNSIFISKSSDNPEATFEETQEEILEAKEQ